ncbi:Acg family FMN-binding oxidoreductase [Rhodococcus sp. O3]|uniref:Acg family FMN-binding oxidoreductase n=1 Tax=Rhodococcus sp. O3 TaxID=3404919 RepID=UPI003B67F3DB
MDPRIPDVNTVKMAVDLACRAPSVHNSQPWRWTYSDGHLDLFSDRSRLLPSTDPSARQLVLSCGAALHHLQIAATALKWSTEIERLPVGEHSNHLASIRFSHGARPASHDFDLVAAIRRRYSDRRPFAPPSAGTGFPGPLREVLHPGTRVTVLPEDARQVLGAATELTAAMRRYDSAYQTELHWWTGHCVESVGIPPEALATAEQSARVDIGRRFPPGSRTSGEAPDIDRSTVLVVSTEGNTCEDWLRAGEALSAVLLEATVDRLATCPLTHVTEFGQSREMIRTLLPEGGCPQALVRVGTTAPENRPKPTPRLPTDSVFTVTVRRATR